MATFTPRGDKWKAEVVRLGVRTSKTFISKRRAELWAAEMEAQILSGTRKAADASETLYATLARYAAEKSTGKRGERWEQIRIKKFQRDIPFVGHKVGDITPDQIGKWRDSRLAEGLKPDSVRRELGLLSAVFEVARREWRLARTNPCADVARPDAAKARSRRISDAEVAALCDAMGYTGGPPKTKGAQAAVAFLLAIETAMRAGEIVTLTRDQVDFDRRVAHLLRTKNGDDRDVPLSTRAVELLRALPGEGRLFTLAAGSLDVFFRNAKKKVGIADLHFHDSRREATSRLAGRFSPMDLAKITGHRDLNLLLRVYYKPDVDVLVAKLD